MMADELLSFPIGVQAVYVRCPDGVERQLEAAQDCTITGKFTQTKKMGDNAVMPLYIINSGKEVKISGKYAKTSITLQEFLMGGTKTQVAALGYTGPEADSADCSMKNAIAVGALVPANYVTDMYIFAAISPTQYTVKKMSTGVIVGTYTVGYPNTTAIPGMTFTVTGTLAAGSYANIKTAGTGDTIEVRSEDADDIPGRLAVRVITEPDNEGNQYSILFYSCISAGSDLALKTKEFAELDFEFEAYEDQTLGKIGEWVRLSTPAPNAC